MRRHPGGHCGPRAPCWDRRRCLPRFGRGHTGRRGRPRKDSRCWTRRRSCWRRPGNVYCRGGGASAQGRAAPRSITLRPTEAEASFREALEVARRQSAKSWELRAATSLARLWQGQGRKRRGPRASRARLRLVHGRLRHKGPEGRQGAARGAGVALDPRHVAVSLMGAAHRACVVRTVCGCEILVRFRAPT